MPQIIVGTTPIDFPDSGSPADWSQAVIVFAQTVAQTLATLASTGDIPVKVMQLTGSDNPVTDKEVTDLVFATDSLRAVHVRYSVYRSTSDISVQETGLMLLLNTDSGWTQSTLLKVGDAKVSFSVDSSNGKLSISTELLSGTNHSGFVSCGAQALAKE